LAENVRAVLVGSETLMGREIRDLAGDLPVELRLVASEEDEAGTLTEQAGEAAVVGALEAESLSDAQLVFLAGSPESSRQAAQLAPRAVFIDLTGASEETPQARLRAPMVEPDGYQVPPGAVQVIAHPAAIAIALLLERLHAEHPVRRAVIQVFEPASERGKAGIDELHQQTVNLFAFKPLPKKIFDEQLGFNMLARYGEEAPVALEEAEARLERHLATLLGMGDNPVPMPSLRLIQAPVFHGHSFSAWVEFDSNPGPATIEEVLAEGLVDVREAGSDPPTAVGMAGQGGVAVGAVAVDRNHPAACWMWMVSDNLRLAAENAVAVARELL